MITRHYNDWAYRLLHTEKGFAFDIKPVKKGSRWIKGKVYSPTKEQARNQAKEEISRKVFEDLLK